MNTPDFNCYNPSAYLTAVLFFTFAFSVQADCDHVGAYIVNLSQDALDVDDESVCTSRDTDFDIRACIAAQIAENLDDNCETDFDVFVPGTKAEHGAWKQFNHMFNQDNNRAHLSLQYDDARDVEEWTNLDGSRYDDGVINSRKSLILLLDALTEHFEVESIRIFGHSKGSHTVSLVSAESPYSDYDFYAFAQPGRTAVDIDDSNDIDAGLLGDVGYIEKLSDNLVGITWANDEVQYYTGNGFNGLSLPEIFSFPGYIWQENTGGGANIFAYVHIDHHNNYGGLYTDGVSGNDWRAGQGTESGNFPYCATGDQYIAEDSAECEKQAASKSPYFWGTPECAEQAFKMMEADNPARYEIGNSGPRVYGSCQESQHVTKVDYLLRYEFNLPDQDCVYKLRFGFEDMNTGVEISSFQIEGTTDNDEVPQQKLGSIHVPIHMNLTIRATIDQRSPTCASAFESEAYIERLVLGFDHPGTGEVNKSRSIIGMREGRGSDLVFQDLHRWDNVAWEQPNINNESIKMYYSAPKNSIKIETVGPTGPNDEGNFQKRVHLLD